MDRFVKQALHNQDFHDCIDAQFQDRFSDWKITSLFYVAIHVLRALAAKRGIDIGATHFEIENNVNPDRQNPRMRITRGAWHDYKAIWKYSQASRYDGFTDAETFELLKQRDHAECLKHLAGFKQYVHMQGVNLAPAT
jgi:hypothetical protein